MMAAYPPQPGAMPPGMAPHAHPSLTPGQPPMTPAQMQQMGHPGGPVTPGPHVTQGGAMLAMQPGANAMGNPAAMGAQHMPGQMGGMPAQMGGQTMAGGMPNAHALAMSQMTPQQIQQQQQQAIMQHNLQNNPQFAQQIMMNRRAAALAAGNGMAGMQQGNMQGLSPQQMQQMQQMQQQQQQQQQQNNQAMHAQGVQLPAHLLAQQQQMQMRMQQQAIAQQQNQQAQQQALAMQQAGSQHSNQGAQPGAQNQQAPQQQHPGQAMRPQSRPNPNEQNPTSGPPANPQAQASPAPSQTPQQQHPQQQAPNGQQQQGQPGPGQQPGQPPQGMTQQQVAAIQRQRQQMQMQQQQNVALQRMAQVQAAQAQQQGQSGIFILKVIQFGDHLSSFDGESGKDIGLWHNFVDRHFAPDARFIHTFAPLPGPPGPEEKKAKRYEVPRPTIARYFQTYFDSSAAYIRLHLEHVRETAMSPTAMSPNRHQVSFSSAVLTVAYPNGARLEMNGSVNVLFAPGSDFIELMELYTANTEEHVTRAEIERLLSSWSPIMANKASPKMAKNKLPKAQQKIQAQLEGLTIDHFPRVSKGKLGITERVQQFLEIDETMCVMADLIAYAQERKVRPEQALEAMVTQYQDQQGNPQLGLPPNAMGMGNRTPSMAHMQMPNAGQFSSPSVSNLNLPMQNGMNGSPGMPPGLAASMSNMGNAHTPSPSMNHMVAPGMVPQHSQQGTNSSAASANTSPNVNNKRRRSTVKVEGDDAGGGEGGNRVKPSPRMPKKAKPGGA